jgi:hypothetical protein
LFLEESRINVDYFFDLGFAYKCDGNPEHLVSPHQVYAESINETQTAIQMIELQDYCKWQANERGLLIH